LVGGAGVTLLLVGLVVRTALVGADRAERQQQQDADMKRQMKSIEREFRLIEQQFSRKYPPATSRRADQPPSQGEAEGKEGGGSGAATPSDP
jgi:hypothetical protein